MDGDMGGAALRQRIEKAFGEAGVPLSAAQQDAFLVYERLLRKWNARFNLTAIRDPGEVIVKHFLDSALVLTHVEDRHEACVADIGSGAGFPGVPVAILRPKWRVDLFEPTKKKAGFLHALIATLALREVRVCPVRIEPDGVPSAYRGRYDVVLSRYTGPMLWLAACARQMTRPGGSLVAHKYADDEERAALDQIATRYGAAVAWRPDERAVARRRFACVVFPYAGEASASGRTAVVSFD